MINRRVRLSDVALASNCWAQVPEAIGGKVPTRAPLVREVTPSVVNISVQGRIGQPAPDQAKAVVLIPRERNLSRS